MLLCFILFLLLLEKKKIGPFRAQNILGWVFLQLVLFDKYPDFDKHPDLFSLKLIIQLSF